MFARTETRLLMPLPLSSDSIIGHCRLALLSIASFLAISIPAGVALAADEPNRSWEAMTVPAARDVALEGPVGAMLQRGLTRLTIPPFTASYIRSDISYEDVHCYYDYSGTNVGEAVEVWSQNSPADRPQPDAFAELLRTIEPFQKPDGHFGANIDARKPVGVTNLLTPVLWGNSRMLAGLLTCWRHRHDENMLRMAKKLGDFYVNTGDAICSPARVKEYVDFVNGNEGIETCYFPAIEGLAMLYAETKDGRYLDQARKMAEVFIEHFDGNRNGHWSGHLMSWRGVLFLYEVTGQRRYLDLCQAKWAIHMRDFASLGGAIGGVGEGFFHDACFHEDWLRWNLELWRLTGNVRYLDVAERLVHNSYGEQQTATGGFGGVCWEETLGVGSDDGVIRNTTLDQPFCCDYMGPGGLVYYKAFLATGNERGVFVNLFDDFTSRVKAAGGDWQVAVRNIQGGRENEWTTEVRLAPADKTAARRVVLFVRIPVWASGVKSLRINDQDVATQIADGYLRVEHKFRKGDVARIVFDAGLRVEGPRLLETVRPEPGKCSVLPSVTIASGPQLLYAVPTPGKGRTTLLATVDKTGKLGLLTTADGHYATIVMTLGGVQTAPLAHELKTSPVVQLQTWPTITTRQRSMFTYNLALVPAESISPELRGQFAKRAQLARADVTGPFFGRNLEKRRELWPGKLVGLGYDSLVFGKNGMLVQGGGVNLIDGAGYDDYRFSFDMMLPKDSQGIGCWVVRARTVNDCLMFRLYCRTSTIDYPEMKEAASPERSYLVPIVIRNGVQTKLAPVAAPKALVHGQTCRIAVECRGRQVEVSADGVKFHSMRVSDLPTGGVGFCASWPWNKGLYSNIRLQKVP